MTTRKTQPQNNNGRVAPARVAATPDKVPVFYTEEDLTEKLRGYRQGVMELRARRDDLVAQLEQTEKGLARTEGAMEAVFAMLNPGQTEQMPEPEEDEEYA